MIAAKRNLISEGVALRLSRETTLELACWEHEVERLEPSYVQHAPHCVVMCVNFFPEQPGMNLRRFIGKHENANILVVSGRLERSLIVELMEADAKGFISSTHTNQDEMLEAMKSVASGRTYLCQQAAEILLGGLFSKEAKEVDSNNLSQREKEIIRYISDGHTSKEIGKLLCISPSTVEVHRRNIMRKLDIHKTAELTKYAIRANLVAA